MQLLALRPPKLELIHHKLALHDQPTIVAYTAINGGRVGKWAPRPMRPKEIDGLLVHLAKAYTLLTDNLITG